MAIDNLRNLLGGEGANRRTKSQGAVKKPRSDKGKKHIKHTLVNNTVASNNMNLNSEHENQKLESQSNGTLTDAEKRLLGINE